MKGSGWLIALGGLAIVAIAVAVVALGTNEDGESEEGSGESIAVEGAPSYDEFVEQIETEPELTTSVTITPDEKTVIVEESTGSSYEIDLPAGEADSLVKTLESNDVEVDAPAN